MTVLILFLIFLGLLCLGLPIAFVLGVTAFIMIAFFSPAPLQMVPEVMYNALDTFPLMAIPFFVIAAQFMVQGGTSRYLINAANCWVRHWWGGLAMVTVISCMIFGALCGSSVATALAIGVIVVPAMIEHGYPRPFALGVVSASGTIAIMIPPSIAMIIYGIMADESIPRLFMAGFLPGIMQGIFYMIWIRFDAKRKNIGGSPKASWDETFRTTYKAIPALCMPIIILGGIYSGFVTVTEAAALGAVAAIFISLFVYREVRPRQVISLTGDAMKSAGMIMFIICTAITIGNWLTEAGLPAKLVQSRQGHEPERFFLPPGGQRRPSFAGLPAGSRLHHADHPPHHHPGSERPGDQPGPFRDRDDLEHGNCPDHSPGGPQPLRDLRGGQSSPG